MDDYSMVACSSIDCAARGACLRYRIKPTPVQIYKPFLKPGVGCRDFIQPNRADLPYIMQRQTADALIANAFNARDITRLVNDRATA